MNTILLNKNTNAVIKQSDIVAQDESGIVINRHDYWQFIPDNNIEKEEIYDEYFPEEDKIALNEKKKYDIASAKTAYTAYTEVAEYRIGFEDFTICTQTLQPYSGLISKKIDVSGSSYISLTAVSHNIENGAVEFYIIDGTAEIPIFPENSTMVINEKLFYGLDTRFPIDYINGEEPILFEDNNALDKSYTQLSAEDFKAHRYTLTYLPPEFTKQHVPASNAIQIKAVIRQYGDQQVYVDHILLKKYGVKLPWTSEQ